jgi:hypothetical protein
VGNGPLSPVDPGFYFTFARCWLIWRPKTVGKRYVKKSGYRDVLRTFVGISPVPALHLHESIAVVRTVTVVWAGVIVRVVRIVRITPIPPPRVPIETETGNEKTAMAVKAPETSAAKAPETPAAEPSETTPAMKASAAMKPAATVKRAAAVTSSAAPSPKPPVSDSIGCRSE